jgi:hypothetical protein
MGWSSHGNQVRIMSWVIIGILVVTARGAEAPPLPDDSPLPRTLNNEDFAALLTHSPFTRSLGASDSLILTGIVQMESDVFATLLDTKTRESHLVSRRPNHRGWQLISIGGNAARVQTWTARIQVTGGEIISIRYQVPPAHSAPASQGGGTGGGVPTLTSAQIDEAKKAAVNYREGFTSDGYPRQPPPEMVEKLSRLSVGQREDINRQMIGLRNKGLGLDERRKIYENLVERSVQGRR